MQVILSFLGAVVAKIFADKILAFIALKIILVTLFIFVVPVLLNNFMYDIIEIMMNFAGAQSSGVGSVNGGMSFTGFMGWLVELFRLPDCLSVLVSALTLRIALSMVPFIRLVG